MAHLHLRFLPEGLWTLGHANAHARKRFQHHGWEKKCLLRRMVGHNKYP